MLKKVVLVLSALALGLGCVNSRIIKKRFESTLNTWVGARIERVIEVWGKPTLIQSMTSGHVAYTWEWVAPEPVPVANKKAPVTAPRPVGANDLVLVPALTAGHGTPGVNEIQRPAVRPPVVPASPRPASRPPVTPENRHCTKVVEVDQKGVVVTWRYSGGLCR